LLSVDCWYYGLIPSFSPDPLLSRMSNGYWGWKKSGGLWYKWCEQSAS